MFVRFFVIFLIVFSHGNVEIVGQSIFEPATFTAATCSGVNEWTTWFDFSDPNLAQGEFEVTLVLQQKFPVFMCPSPIAIEALTVTDQSPASTGDVFRLTAKDGFLCLNQQIVSFKHKLCADYKVRYCCAKSAIGQTNTVLPSIIPPTTTAASVVSNTCGRQSIYPSAQRIVGGAEAIPNSWPWIVSIQTSDHFCGGTLIDTRHVLTAAHCLTSAYANQLRVVAGLHQRSNLNTGRTQIIGVSRIFNHEQYDSIRQTNDIAILRLSQPVQLNAYVSLICLPGPDPQEYASVTVAGWGTTRKGTSLPNALQQVTVQVLNSEAAVAYSAYFNVQRQIAAGIPRIGGKDSCQGDSGGPLMYKSNDQWYLTGVVSFGNDCALSYNPGVYTRTSAYLSWIRSKLTAN